MRAITVNFWQNLGTKTPGAQCSLTGNVTKIGRQVLTVDEQLTKITPGNITIEVQDPGDVIWAFIQNNLTISSGLLPPYIQLLVGGAQVFLGLVDPSQLVRHLSSSTHSIELAAQDWSIELANTYLGAPTALPWLPNHTYTVGNYVMNGGTTYLCMGGGVSAASGGPSGVLSPILDGPGNLTWAYVAPSWVRPVPTVANTGTPQAYPGYSDDYVNLQRGVNTPQVFFPDPCGWIYTGAVLQGDRPVFHYLPRDGQGLPRLWDGERGAMLGDTAYDIDHQWHIVQWVGGDEHGGPGWVKQTTWSTPIGVPSNALPSAQFPAGMIICNSVGTKWQVSADGLSWVSVYNAAGDGSWFKVQPSPADQVLMTIPGAGLSTNFWNQSVFCNAHIYPQPWPTPLAASYSYPYSLQGSWSINFTLANPLAADLDYWTVMVPIPSDPATPCHVLTLNSVNGPVMGDKLEIVDNNVSQQFTVAGVDPVLSQINTLEALTGVPLGAHVYWTADSQNEMVMEDPRTILARAALPFSVDLSRFTAPATADPMLGLLPLRPTIGADLFAVGDIETTLTSIKFSTGGTWVNPATGAPLASYSWTGTPDLGWAGPTATAPAAPMTDWTCQLVGPPASQMPYESGSLASTNFFQRLRNRAYGDATYRQENNGLIAVTISGTTYLVNGAYVQTTVTPTGQTVYQYTQNGTTYTTATATFVPWTPNGACLANGFFCYDYTAMRRLTFTGNSVSVRSWSGAAWGGASGYSWPGGSYIQSAVPMIGTAGALLAYAVTPVNNLPTADRLELWGLSGGLLNAGTATVPLALIGGTLVTTPWAVYLVGASAIALVTLVGNVITFTTLSMVDSVDVLFPNTLTARTQAEIVIFGRLDAGVDGTETETWMYRVNAVPQPTLDKSILWSEKVIDGAPSLIGAVRDPSKAGRIVGHIGGSIFQVDSVRPYCVERWCPGGQTALSAIEHVCQLYGAMAVPGAFGVLHIISRVNSDAPTALTVKQIKLDSTRNWASYSSIVRVTSPDGKYVYDAQGGAGGALMEITDQPMVWSLSGCAGMAESMAAWFGAIRPVDVQAWTYPDPDTAPPWEALPPFAKVVLSVPAINAYPFFTGDGVIIVAPLSGPLGGPVYNPAVTGLWCNDWQGNTPLLSIARTNLALQSQGLTAPWVVNAAARTLNALTAPDGSVTASKFIEDTTNAQHFVDEIFAQVAGVTYTKSVFVKLIGARTQVWLQDYMNGTDFCTVVFNLAAGTVTSISGPQVGSTAGIIPYPNGWFRIWIKTTSISSGSHAFAFGPWVGSASYLGDGASGFYGWGAQQEIGNLTRLIFTTTVPVTVTDWALAGNAITFGKAPGRLAIMTWSGTYQSGPWRVMSMSQDYIEGAAEVTLVGAP